MDDISPRSFFDRVLDIIQSGTTSLIPMFMLSYVNTGNRAIDAAITTIVSSLTTTIIPEFFAMLRDPMRSEYVKYSIYEWLSGWIYLAAKTRQGFLYHALPTLNLRETRNLPSVCTYFDNITSMQRLTIITWLNKNIKIAKYAPSLEFVASLTRSTAATFNTTVYAYPFYYVGKDIIYWDLSTGIGMNVRFWSTSQIAVDAFIKVMKAEGILPREIEPFSIREVAITTNTEKETRICTYGNKGLVQNDDCANSSRTFDSLFFEQKDEMLRLVKKFRKGTLYPKHIHADNKLGILLHGPPGTGKSAFVVALANSLGMDIVLVDMTKITTCTEFDNLLKLSKMRMLVFEEMDCVLGVLRKRSIEGQQEEAAAAQEKTPYDSEYEMLMSLFVGTDDREEKKKIMMRIDTLNNEKKNALHLGYILQRLDGIYNESGRVIIGCTNHPDLIDPALLRPGRFGIRIEMGNCTHKMMIDIISYYMQLGKELVEHTTERIAKLPEYHISPASLIQRIQMMYDEEADKAECLGKLLDYLLRTIAP